jgi:N-acetylmuramoyl-L-alanine amidase
MDLGAKGKFGTLEKNITLAVSFKLKALIEQNLPYRVVLTRDKDIDVSMENRSAIANNNDAVLFISIHTNGSFRKKAQGSETFFLSLNAPDEETRKLAYMENTSSELEKRIEDKNKDEVKTILWDMAQSAYIKQSSQLAEEIQKELNIFLGTENRGIKQAPFKVLKGVACPAILVEVAFISNPEEEQKLIKDDFQRKVAEAIYQGLKKYTKLFS